MIKKRLVGVVTVRDSIAVQSFGYGRYLPLGKPEVLVENLDRWGADEILLQCIDRTPAGTGPDFQLLEKVGRKGLSTPLIYAGGIGSIEDGVRAIQAGADRVCVDALLHDAPAAAAGLAERLGAQAIIACLPLACTSSGVLWRDYRTGADEPLPRTVTELLASRMVSEVLLVDWRHEGTPRAFDLRLIDAFPVSDVPLIVFGGLSDAAQLRAALASPRVVATAVGNFLSYREHAVQEYKRALAGLPVRAAAFESRIAP